MLTPGGDAAGAASSPTASIVGLDPHRGLNVEPVDGIRTLDPRIHMLGPGIQSMGEGFRYATGFAPVRSLLLLLPEVAQPTS